MDEDLLVSPAALEVATASEQQSLFDCSLESIVTLLDIAVLVRPASLRLPARETVMAQERLVVASELVGVLDFLDRGAEAVGLMHSWHATERPQRVLQSKTQALEALREADCSPRW